jgi:hypothetical protein
MGLGFVAGLAFIAGCWLALRQQWGFPLVLAAGAVAWLGTVLLPSLAWRWMR